ncbi:WGR domain-containing protein [Pedobacter xixiisoli]|uniref:WGR domain-containing protein n=1 Tax=Pedobacter xixiisoli TaxID=1476464 RepID=A0A285ZUM7_9SPHI|nr:WGR domain-containing protein [Pedobacter xixiisoli]SOD13355.1 WGR domain-containing protein [Pedobacter xixiisoli]
MKLIKQSRLFFKEGKSDKVYEIDLCELSTNEFLVNFRYGRRGNTLKEGTKTPSALQLDKAEILFAELENEKRKKGYQTETEVFMELPSLDAIEPDTLNGVILQRLQDAIVGRNSFKTEWKTSRVIWKAGLLGLQEAIPFIIKLATRGNEMQTYAALYALIKLNATTAEPLFTALANNVKQKSHILNVAFEGLLTIANETEQQKLCNQLLEKLPTEVRYAIEIDDLELLTAALHQNTENKEVDHFTSIYLLCKIKPQILSVFSAVLKTWNYRPPYFKHLRAIYKLAQLRNDAVTLALLSYGFEKQPAMFRRTYALDSNSRPYLTVIDQAVKVGAELKNKDSKLAFSQYTKAYFQKNAVDFLKQTAIAGGSTAYLKLAVNILLQYKEKDYTIAQEKPLSDYGRYDYKTKLYTYYIVNYPECSDALLLSTILFGNDSERKLQANLKFITNSRTVVSSSYYYNSSTVFAAPAQNSGFVDHTSTGSVIDAAKNIFKNLFGKKNVVPPPSAAPVIHTEIEQKNEVEMLPRLELYPELWDAMPEAYVQLLMQAEMGRIHLFAYERLKAHPKFEEISQRFDERAILQLLNSKFDLPNKFGFEILKSDESKFAGKLSFVAKILGSNTEQARNWAQQLVNTNSALYFNDIEFVLTTLFNIKEETKSWIDERLQIHEFSDERAQAILGKTIAELLNLENTEENNLQAKSAINRLFLIAQAQAEKLSWTIVEQLMASSLSSNQILAAKILLSKVENVSATEIPITLTEMLLLSEFAEVRDGGIDLLNRYPDHFLSQHIHFLLKLIDQSDERILDAVFATINRLVVHQPEIGNTVVPALVYALMRKEKFEGAHAKLSGFLLNQLKGYWNTGLQPKEITKLVHAQYRTSQLAGYEILKAYADSNRFSLRQIISFGSHEILAIRQWSWNYFKQNVERIREQRNQSLYLTDSKWDDTRAYAFHFFKTEFTATDWDADTLISIVDSIRPDVESFGKEMITRFFNAENALTYLTKLSEHPSVNVQSFVSSYLSTYAKNQPHLLQELTFYFRSVLTRVNKARVAKNRVFSFISEEALTNQETAAWAVGILDDVSAQSTVQDKATCIDILTKIKAYYPELDMHLTIKN